MTTIHYKAYDSETSPYCGSRSPSLHLVGKAEADQVTCRGACGKYAAGEIRADRRRAMQAQKNRTPTEALILDFLEDWGQELRYSLPPMRSWGVSGATLATDDDATTFSDLVGALCEERRAVR
jgi:hypothetical protein